MIKKLLVLMFSIMLITTSAYAEAPKQGKMSGGVQYAFPAWFKESFLDFREDAAEAADSGKHLMLFFHVAGCPYCNQMLEDNFVNGDNTETIKEQYDVIEVDLKGSKEIDFDEDNTVTESELGEVLKVRFTPTILFMNKDNKVVTRLNGYRSPREFKTVLKYISDKEYEKGDFNSYREKHLTNSVYSLKDDPRYLKETDLSKLAKSDKPLAILIEDAMCDECENFHKDIFGLPETQKILDKYNLVRLDGRSDAEITDPEGNKTTIKGWLNKRDISYRPSVLLYSEGKEIEKSTGLLKSYHFQQLLNYVADKQYDKYETWIKYLGDQSKKILESGKDIDIWK